MQDRRRPWVPMAATVASLLVPTFVDARDVPSSPRSRGAVLRNAPRLDTELRAAGLHLGSPVFIRVFKRSRELELWVDDGERFRLFRTYDVCAYSGELGPKLRQGDRQAPEGFYFVSSGRLNPHSRYHLSMNLGYPNAYDRAHGRTGSALMIHGVCASDGCFAMTNRGIEAIWTLVDAALRGGQPFVRVHVFPFRLTREALEREGETRWHAFWQNLREGYEWFEREGRPPNVELRDGRYVFERDPRGGP